MGNSLPVYFFTTPPPFIIFYPFLFSCYLSTCSNRLLSPFSSSWEEVFFFYESGKSNWSAKKSKKRRGHLTSLQMAEK